MKRNGHPPQDQYAAFNRALRKSERQSYRLRLYVTGATPKSQRAIENIKRICEQYLGRSYQLEVIDLYQQPELAQGEQIVAAPTLVKVLPPGREMTHIEITASPLKNKAGKIILAGFDEGWALRMVPNQLYYAFWVPFAWFAFFARR